MAELGATRIGVAFSRVETSAGQIVTTPGPPPSPPPPPPPPPTPAPVFSLQPTVSPGTGIVGNTFTGFDGFASDTDTYSRRWLLNGTSIGTGSTVVPVVPGSLVLEVTATGVGGVTIATSTAATVGSGSESSALPAPTITRTTGATTYPPVVEFTRPIEWQNGDTAVMQRTTDPTFATGVTEKTQTLAAETTTYDFDLDTITSGSWYVRMAAWRGSRPGSLTWSNIINVGDVVAPTLSGGGATNSDENSPMAVTITSDELAYFALGGTDAALLELNSTAANTSVVVRLVGNAILNREAKTTYSFTVTATDFAGNASSPLAVTHTVNNVVENPSGLTNFTTQTNATLGATYRPTAQTIAGLPTGYAAFASATGGTLVKNGVNVGASSTYVNGDTITVDGVAPGAVNSSTTVTVNIGGDATPVTVTFAMETAASVPQLASMGIWVQADDTSKLFQTITGTTAVAADGDVVGTLQDRSANGRHMTATANSGVRPTFRVLSGHNAIQFDGSDDMLRWLGTMGLWNASGFTAVIAMRSNGNGTNKAMLATGSTLSNSPILTTVGSFTTATDGFTDIKNDAGVTVVSQNQAAGVFSGTDKVIIVQDDGSGVTWYVDGVAGTRRAYTRGSNTLTLNNTALGALSRTTPGNHFAGYVHGMAIWPAVQLTSGERAQALTHFAALQGRTL